LGLKCSHRSGSGEPGNMFSASSLQGPVRGTHTKQRFPATTATRKQSS
jgi:hypothetical protein